jgi:hypothetical protein
MKIVAWKNVQVDEDGNTTSSWIACHVGKAVTASGPTAANAIFELVRWLQLSLDEDEDRVPPLDLVIYDYPKFAEDQRGPGDGARKSKGERLTEEDQLAMYEESKEGWLKKGLPVPPIPPPRALYESSISLVQERFDAGQTFVDDHVQVPSGWDVRIWEA